jgi:RHS repeat-associated protein
MRDATGLDYADQRYYTSGWGRFTVPDSDPGSKRDPISLNRYAYTGNDPIGRLDPNGRSWIDAASLMQWDGGGGGGAGMAGVGSILGHSGFLMGVDGGYIPVGGGIGAESVAPSAGEQAYAAGVSATIVAAHANDLVAEGDLAGAAAVAATNPNVYGVQVSEAMAPVPVITGTITYDTGCGNSCPTESVSFTNASLPTSGNAPTQPVVPQMPISFSFSLITPLFVGPQIQVTVYTGQGTIQVAGSLAAAMPGPSVNLGSIVTSTPVPQVISDLSGWGWGATGGIFELNGNFNSAVYGGPAFGVPFVPPLPNVSVSAGYTITFNLP